MPRQIPARGSARRTTITLGRRGPFSSSASTGRICTSLQEPSATDRRAPECWVRALRDLFCGWSPKASQPGPAFGVTGVASAMRRRRLRRGAPDTRDHQKPSSKPAPGCGRWPALSEAWEPGYTAGARPSLRALTALNDLLSPCGRLRVRPRPQKRGSLRAFVCIFVDALPIIQIRCTVSEAGFGPRPTDPRIAAPKRPTPRSLVPKSALRDLFRPTGLGQSTGVGWPEVTSLSAYRLTRSAFRRSANATPWTPKRRRCRRSPRVVPRDRRGLAPRSLSRNRSR